MGTQLDHKFEQLRQRVDELQRRATRGPALQYMPGDAYEEEPVRSLARKVLSNPMNGPVERRVATTLQHIARYQCRGAIHFSHWGCRQSSGALHIVRTRLRKEGVPLMVLDGDCVDPVNLQMGPLRTRVEAFIEMSSKCLFE